jgi:DNA polymerase I-like protein with 3'-5' exonuclease and polymerase domains
MGKYYVVDLETTVRNKGPGSVGRFAAHPQCKDNHIVLYAYKKEGDDKGKTYDNRFIPLPPEDMDIVIGHNIAFDIQYLIQRSEAWRDWFLSPKSKIWDTMIAEYILSGQSDKYASLDYCALKHAGASDDAIDFFVNMHKLEDKAANEGPDEFHKFQTDKALFYATWGEVLKPDRIKEYWDAGYDTTDIPREELEDYAIGDVENTEMIFLSQIEIADQQNQIDLIQTMMESRMATIEMEYNGFAFDKAAAIDEAALIEAGLGGVQRAIQANADKLLVTHVSSPVVLEATSGPQLSKLIFGGSHKYKVKENMLDENGDPVLYKSGKKKGEPRTKIVTKEVGLPTLLDPDWISKTTALKNGWKLDDAVVEEIIAYLSSTRSPTDMTHDTILEIAKLLKEARMLQKDLTAFYRPYVDLTWDDGRIHANFSHTATDTGRLSCSNPNIQQVSGK